MIFIAAAPNEFTKPIQQTQNDSNNVVPKTAWWICTFILILQKI